MNWLIWKKIVGNGKLWDVLLKAFNNASYSSISSILFLISSFSVIVLVFRLIALTTSFHLLLQHRVMHSIEYLVYSFLIILYIFRDLSELVSAFSSLLLLSCFSLNLTEVTFIIFIYIGPLKENVRFWGARRGSVKSKRNQTKWERVLLWLCFFH